MPEASNNSLKLRENVAGILRDRAGRILIAERIDIAGAWQFPQGGVDPGETLEEAVIREMKEELSLRPAEYRLIDRKGPYLYLFGDGKLKKGFHGKNQHFFLGEFVVDNPRIDVETEHAEFRDARWIQPRQFKLEWLPTMKRELYQSVFRDFFALEL